jgi:TDG/mug DNA glycosylase family protein
LAVAPRVFAFNGLKAAREALGDVDGYGRQPRSFADAETWVLPSTSGAANRWWDPAPWQQLADHLR